MTTDDVDTTKTVLVVTTQVVDMKEEDRVVIHQVGGLTTQVLFKNNQARFQNSKARFRRYEEMPALSLAETCGYFEYSYTPVIVAPPIQ